MKRISTTFLLGLILTLIVACGGVDDETRIEDALSELDYLEEDHEEAPDFPDGIGGVDIEWRFFDKHILHPEGFLNRPVASGGEEEVTVEATLTYNDTTREESFSLSILPRAPLNVEGMESVPLEDLANEYTVKGDAMDIYTMEDLATPYVDVLDFLKTLDGAIRYEELEFEENEDTLTIYYEETFEEDEEFDDELYEMTLDFEENTLRVNRYGFFASLSEETETDFGEGLEVVDYEVELQDDVVIDLSDYRFELHDDDAYLMPFHLANLLFSGNMFDAYYNGEKVFGVDTYQIMDNIGLHVLNDSYWNDETMHKDMRYDTFNHLALSFDHFYGLKEDYEVESYYEEFLPYFEDIMSEDATTHYDALFDLALDADDPHTSYVRSGPFDPHHSPTVDQLEQLGERTRAFNEFMISHMEHCGMMPEKDTHNNLGVIRLDGFDEDTPGLVEEYLDAFEDDAEIDSVVFDFTCNTGGVLGAVYQIVGFMTDENIEHYSRNAGDGSQSVLTYTSENEAYDFEFYIKTSPATYSAANFMVSIAKDMDIATIVGTSSQGGAASVTTNITPAGSIFVMSSDNILTNMDHESIELGLSPHIELSENDLDSNLALYEAIRDYEND